MMQSTLRWYRFGMMIAFMCVLASTFAGCGSSTTVGAPQGWTSYHDAHYAFQMPIPPGWHVRSVVDPLSTGAACDYIVEVFPPDVKVGTKLSDRAEQVFVRVILGCDRWPIGGHDEFFTSEPKTVTVSGTPATMYDSNPNAGWPQREAVTQFGGHEYILGLQSPPEHAQRDLAAYTQMLRGFHYQGT